MHGVPIIALIDGYRDGPVSGYAFVFENRSHFGGALRHACRGVLGILSVAALTSRACARDCSIAQQARTLIEIDVTLTGAFIL
jgi:hypothetical protein